MTITPPLSLDDDDLNELANDLAHKLSNTFDVPLVEAEEHIRKYYVVFDNSRPLARQILEDNGSSREPMSAKDAMGHDYWDVVLEIGYRLRGGTDVRSEEYSEWRNLAWNAVRSGQPVPLPRF